MPLWTAADLDALPLKKLKKSKKLKKFKKRRSDEAVSLTGADVCTAEPPQPAPAGTIGFGGVDPGTKGFLAAVSETQVLFCEPVPFSNGDFDLPELWETVLRLKRHVKYVVLEKQQAMGDQGPVGCFSLGRAAGHMEAMLVAAGIPHELVAPISWKSLMGILAKPIKMEPAERRALVEARKRRKHDPAAKALVAVADKRRREQKKVAKGKAIVLAGRMFPGFDLRMSERARVPHDGKAEALLLAVFARRRFLAR